MRRYHWAGDGTSKAGDPLSSYCHAAQSSSAYPRRRRQLPAPSFIRPQHDRA